MLSLGVQKPCPYQIQALPYPGPTTNFSIPSLLIKVNAPLIFYGLSKLFSYHIFKIYLKAPYYIYNSIKSN